MTIVHADLLPTSRGPRPDDGHIGTEDDSAPDIVSVNVLAQGHVNDWNAAAQTVKTIGNTLSMPLVLVIDDEPGMRALLARTLKRAGYPVIEAVDGKKGLDVLRTETPDIVITDLFMPERDGFEVIQAVRRSSRPVKILVISGGASSGRVDFLEIARKLGADATLAKPFNGQQLLQQVEMLLDNKELESDPSA